MSVVQFPGDGTISMARDPRSLDTPVADVLKGAVEAGDRLRAVAVFGLTHDGDLFGASSSNSIADTLLLIRRVEKRLLENFSGDVFA